MIKTSTLQFLSELQQNNHKPWFDEHRQEYETAKANFLELVSVLIPTIGKFDEPIGDLLPKDCTFRINRDVRFSKNKDPYKTNLAAYFNRGGKKEQAAGYYLHIEPGKSFAAGGMYGPMPPQLAAIRQEIDYNFADWKKIVESKKFLQAFPQGVEGMETLVRPPKGYDESNPAIKYLKMKSFIVSQPISDEQLSSKTITKTISGIFEKIHPMIAFLNQAVS